LLILFLQCHQNLLRCINLCSLGRSECQGRCLRQIHHGLETPLFLLAEIADNQFRRFDLFHHHCGQFRGFGPLYDLTLGKLGLERASVDRIALC